MNSPTPLRVDASNFDSAAIAVEALTAPVPANPRPGDGRTTLKSFRADRRGATRGALLKAALLGLLCLVMCAFAVPASAQPVEGSQAPASHAAAAQASDSYQLRFHNYYNQTVSVAIMYRDYSGACDSYGGWATKGWWNIEPGGERYVLNTRNRHVYFYAHTPNNQYVWTGSDHHMYVGSYAFNSCRDIGSTSSRYVGIRHIDMGSSFTNYTFPLYVND